MKRKLLLIAALLFLLLPSCDFLKNNNPFNRKSRERAWQLQMQMQIDSIRKVDSLQNVEKIRLQAIQDSVIASEATAVNKSNFKYHIIVGSFLTPEYAQAHSDYYARKGYETELIDMTNSRFRLVSASSYSSMPDAWRALQGYRDTVEYGAWIYLKE